MRRRRVFKSELLPRDLFDLVPIVIAEPKYFPFSLDTIVGKFEARERVDEEFPHQTLGGIGKAQRDLILRLALMGIPPYPDGWHISLLLYNKRIDGFGYDHRFYDSTGNLCKGWHRHVWNPIKRDAEGREKVHLFKRADLTFRNFLLRAFKQMKITYPRDQDNETYNLNLFTG